MKKRIGIIGSSGGSALIAAIECLLKAGHKLEPIIIVDRECGLKDWARNQNYKIFHVVYNDPESFSKQALHLFQNEGCEDVLLFYSRRVAKPLIDTLQVWNIHPALLPSFRGLNAVKQALLASVSLFGATLHRVDAGLDTGPIIAQVVAPLSLEFPEARAQRLSYIQKVWLTLIFFECIFLS
jgi:phosphoribosylglycinamide formyltransferase-1